ADEIMDRQELYALRFFSAYSLLQPFATYIQGFTTSYLAVPAKGGDSFPVAEAILASALEKSPVSSSARSPSLDSLGVPRLRTPHPGKTLEGPVDTEPEHREPEGKTSTTQQNNLGMT